PLALPLFLLPATAPPPPLPSPLSLHDALPIYGEPLRHLSRLARRVERAPDHAGRLHGSDAVGRRSRHLRGGQPDLPQAGGRPRGDRKSTRLNSSHLGISYAVFCLKKKKTADEQ